MYSFINSINFHATILRFLLFIYPFTVNDLAIKRKMLHNFSSWSTPLYK